MASYWQNAKKEAKKRAKHSGYCWVWFNPITNWKEPYFFYESDVDVLPPWVPKDAMRFGDGPYQEPKPTGLTLEDVYKAFGVEMEELKEEVKQLKASKPKPVPTPPVTTTKPMLRTARDPHHNGCAEWGYDGYEFWQRQFGSKQWIRVKRSHLTVKRVQTLYQLIVGIEEPSC